MTTKSVVLGAPVVVVACLGVGYGFDQLGRTWAAQGDPCPGEEEPCTCGEDLRPGLVQLFHHSFFRLGLTFSVLRLAILMVSTPPGRHWFQPVGLICSVGIVISVLVLVRLKTEERR